MLVRCLRKADDAGLHLRAVFTAHHPSYSEASGKAIEVGVYSNYSD
jgi:hypothetical protein